LNYLKVVFTGSGFSTSYKELILQTDTGEERWELICLVADFLTGNLYFKDKSIWAKL